MSAPLTDIRAVGWRLPLVLSILVTLDELLALGALGVVPRASLPLGARIASGLGSVVVLTGVLLVARWTWLRSRAARARDWPTIVTVLLAAQLAVQAGSTMAPDGTPAGSGSTRLDAVLFLTGTTFVVLAALGALERHRHVNATLVATAAHLRAAYARSVDAVGRERSRLAVQVRGLLEERLGPTSLRPALFTAERLREIADATLRPLAHQLERAGAKVELPPAPPTRRAAVRQVLRALQAPPVVNPRILAATMFLLTFRFSIGEPSEELAPPSPLPGGEGALQVSVDWASFVQSLTLHAATVTAVLLGGRILANFLARGHGRSRGPAGELSRAWSIAVGGLLVLGLTSLALLRAMHSLPGLSELPRALPPVDPSVTVGFIAPLIIITAVTSILPAVEQALAAMREQLAAANQELERATARANALLDHERRLFARHLHASTQAAVNAASLMIERASADGDVDPDVITRAAGIIDGAVEQLVADSKTTEHGQLDGPDDLADRISAILATWEDLATCTITLEPAARDLLEADPVTRATACDLVAEACANAVIHGRATAISVEVTVTADGGPGAVRGASTSDLLVRVTDDGVLPEAQRTGGLGSRILTASTTHWSLEHDAHGTTLTAIVPVR